MIIWRQEKRLEFYDDTDEAHFVQSDYVLFNIGQKQCNIKFVYNE